MKEALLYDKLLDGSVRCNLCHHRCIIQPDKRGICRVRENRHNRLYALNYGKTIAAAIDPIEKKPLYHFLPGTKVYSFATVGCNFRCSWCQNWEISQNPERDQGVMGIDITPEEHVARALENDCPSIAYTYSEPTIFLEYALDTMKLARAAGLKNVWVTNGFMTPEALDLILPYLDAANVDYKGPDNDVYVRYCGGRAEPVVENMKRMQYGGVHLEVTTLVIPGVNDEPDQLKRLVGTLVTELGTALPWHISRFFSAWKMANVPVTPYSTLELARKIGADAGLKTIHIGNV
ncbi:MAG: AmmeMemoRadiSam system radical SAM enzyme [Bacilli bacterium]|nr:AmmeMemoRadiSam system radical SAM enzyme [Bacilli bacterium]MBN2696152.1 AmmeMemoRadiSam system radical SAM enzyme [Bacilli bacterium]